MRNLVTSLVTGLLLLGATACGGDEESGLSGDEKKAAEALATSMERTGATEVDRAFSTCLSEGVVEELGVEELEKSGLLTEDGVGRFGTKVDRATAEVIGDVTVDCYDFEALIEPRKSSYPKVSDQGWETYVDCVDGLDPQLRASVAEANQKGAGTKAQAALNKAMATCAKPLVDAQAGNR